MTFFFFLFSEALLLFVGFIVIFIVTFTNSTVFPTMNSTMDTLSVCKYIESIFNKVYLFTLTVPAKQSIY